MTVPLITLFLSCVIMIIIAILYRIPPQNIQMNQPHDLSFEQKTTMQKYSQKSLKKTLAVTFIIDITAMTLSIETCADHLLPSTPLLHLHVLTGIVSIALAFLCTVILPSRLPLLNNNAFLRFASSMAAWWITLCSPILWVLERFLNQHVTTHDEINIKEHIHENNTTSENAVEQAAEMIEGVIEIGEATASEIMTPRTDMLCVDIESDCNNVAEIFKSSGFSRLPAYEGNRDHIVGILYYKDFIRSRDTNGQNISGIREILRTPHFVPESKRVAELLREMQMKKIQIAIILDEYGGTAGLISTEDIIEEIVGEIEDENEVSVPESFRIISPGVIEVDAKLHVDELNEKMKINIPENKDYETIGGFIISNLGRIPSPRETFSFQNIEFAVLNGDNRRITLLKLTVKDMDKK